MESLLISTFVLLLILGGIWWGGKALEVPVNVLTFLMIVLVVLFALLVLTGRLALAF